MRLIKLAILSFVFFFLLITGISFFFPSHIRISRAVNLAAPVDSILAPIRDPVRWRSWYPGLDTAAYFMDSGRVRGYQLDSAGRLYIIMSGGSDSSVEATMTNRRLQPISVTWQTIRYASTDSVTLQWYMDIRLRWYPWEKFGSLFLEPSFGIPMERGLGNLRRMLNPPVK